MKTVRQSWKMNDQDIQYVTQLIVCHRQISECNLSEMLRKMEITEDPNDLVSTINQRLAHINLKVVKTCCELTDERFYVIIPLTFKEETFKSSFTDSELVFFKKIIMFILESRAGTISTDIIDNLMQETQISSTGVDALILRLAREKYVMKVDEELALTALCVAEFSTFLKINFEHLINVCKLCSNIIIKGVKCRSCESLCHKYCLNMLFANQRTKKCPECRELWNDPAIEE